MKYKAFILAMKHKCQHTPKSLNEFLKCYMSSLQMVTAKRLETALAIIPVDQKLNCSISLSVIWYKPGNQMFPVIGDL